MNITFRGAARTVTGSMHEITANGHRILLDCGQYQGRRQESLERNTRFAFPAREVDAVLLSHAHIDHSGILPVLVKQGFSGPIYTTQATADLCVPMLADSAHLQETDAEFLNKRRSRRRSLLREVTEEEAAPIQPMFTSQDAENTTPLFRPVTLHTPTEVAPGVTYTSYDAGHMLGSTFMVVEAMENGKPVRLGFSGDVGRPGLPIVRDPDRALPVDYLILESTYGNRLHQALEGVKERVATVIRRTAGRGGKVIVPSFAVGRAQQLVLILHELMNTKAIPPIPIFVDSPLAVNVTEVFRRHQELFDDETRAFLEGGEDPFGFSRLRYVREAAESKALNDLRGSFVVISASGMCEAGRILHHLRNNISDPRNTVMITGFQAENTLGRKIVERQQEVPIFGEPIRLRAEVAIINELSGHADQGELLAWMKPAVPTLKKVFLVHGEPDQSAGLKKAIEERYGVEAVIPERNDEAVLTL